MGSDQAASCWLQVRGSGRREGIPVLSELSRVI